MSLVSLQAIAFYLVIAVANIFQGITGFAGTILAMTPSVMLVGYPVAKPVLNLLGLLAGAIMFVPRRKLVDKKQLLKVLVMMTLGILAGIGLHNLFREDVKILYKVFGIFVVLLAINGFVRAFYRARYPERRPKLAPGNLGGPSKMQEIRWLAIDAREQQLGRKLTPTERKNLFRDLSAEAIHAENTSDLGPIAEILTSAVIADAQMWHTVHRNPESIHAVEEEKPKHSPLSKWKNPIAIAWGYVLLVLAGIAHGIFVSGGPLLISYLAKNIENKDRFRATISLIWVVLNTVILLDDVRVGYWDPHLCLVALVTVPFLLIGMAVGAKLYYKLNANAFVYLTYALLLVSGILLLTK